MKELSTNPLWQSSLIIISLLFVLMWSKSPLFSYTTQLIAFLVFLYVYSAFNKKTGLKLGEYFQPLQITILITITTLLIVSSGGLNSSLFFLVYFIPFALSLIFKPETVFVLAIGLTGIFLLHSPMVNLAKNLPILVSILFLSPLAYFFGRQFQKTRITNNTTEVIKKIDTDVEAIITTEKDKLTTQSIQNLGDIVEEAEKLSSKDEK